VGEQARKSDPLPAAGSSRVDAEPAFQTPWMTIRRAWTTDEGGEAVWHYLDHPGCALVVPLLRDGSVLMLRQWRVSVSAWCWELPAGRIEPGESPEAAALRELAEESGGKAGRIEYLGSVFSSNGSSNEKIYSFAATGVDISRAYPDPAEQLVCHTMTTSEAMRMALAGEIDDGPSALAILWAHGRGLLR
jgi:ADP-ribose pyrophosphatase